MPYNGVKGSEDNMGRRKQGRRGNGFGGVSLRGNIWFARYTDALGVRREVSTHTSNKEEALRILATYTTPIRESHSQEEIKLRLQQSIDVLELRKDIKRIERLRIDELPTKFLNHRNLADAQDGTKCSYSKHLNNLVRVIHDKYPSINFVDEVTMEVVECVMGELTKHYTPTSYNLALATYRRCWGLFSRNNPFMKIAKRKIDKSRHRMNITEDDIRRIFNSCRDDVERAVWGCGIYLGLRCGDVCSLTYGNLTKDLNTAVVIPMKTRKHMPDALHIPICSSLKNMLLKVLDFNKIGNDDYKNTPLWEDYKKRYRLGISTWFGTTLKRAGLSTSHKDEQGHLQVDTGFHITRHCFVSFASRFMSPLLVQKIVGHSSLKMTSHYFHTNEEEMRKGLEQMPDFGDDTQEGKKAPRNDSSEEVMKLLGMMKEGQESPLETLKRLISKASTYEVAS